MKYCAKILKEVRYIIQYEVEADSIQDAKNLLREKDEKDGEVIWDDCTDFEILEVYQTN